MDQLRQNSSGVQFNIMDQLKQNSSGGDRVADPMADTTSAFPPPPARQSQRKRKHHQITDVTELEVIALSAETLTGENLFSCELCNRGFNREQNLKLHRRGHNIPGNLKNKNKKKVDKVKVYVCPEARCPNHNPSKGLLELTSIKKHYKRKHVERNLKCTQCCKKYSVQSDLNAHLKICGTREYKCDCGCVFSRQDSFVTHRTLCDETQQSTKLVLPVTGNSIPTTSLFSLPIFSDSVYQPTPIPSLNTNTLYFPSNTLQAVSFSSRIFSNQTDYGTATNNIRNVHGHVQQFNYNNGHTTVPDSEINIFDVDFLYERLCAVSSPNLTAPVSSLLQPAPQPSSLSTNPITSTSTLRSFRSSTVGSAVGGIDTNNSQGLINTNVSSLADEKSYFSMFGKTI